MKKLFVMLGILMMSIGAFAGGRTSCRLYGDEDNMAALNSNFVCTTPHYSSGKPGINVDVTLEKPAKGETVVYVEVEINNRTYNVRVEISKGAKEGHEVLFDSAIKSGDCGTLSIASGSCRI